MFISRGQGCGCFVVVVVVCVCWGGGGRGARFVTVVYVTETVVVLCPTCVLAASLGPLPMSGLQPDSLVSQPVSVWLAGVPACLSLTHWCPRLSHSDSLVFQSVFNSLVSQPWLVGVPACLSLTRWCPSLSHSDSLVSQPVFSLTRWCPSLSQPDLLISQLDLLMFQTDM